MIYNTWLLPAPFAVSAERPVERQTTKQVLLQYSRSHARINVHSNKWLLCRDLTPGGLIVVPLLEETHAVAGVSSSMVSILSTRIVLIESY
jgi:hypothetical protein